MERMGGCDEGIDEFIQAVPEYLVDDIAEVKEALNSDDVEGILRSAHKIKGMCANASAERLREAAYRMESAAKEGDIDAVRLFFRLLKQEEKALREYVAQTPP